MSVSNTTPTNLDDALRLIAQLRKEIAWLQADNEDLHMLTDEVAGEHTAFLDAEHERKLQLLYTQNKLVYDQDADMELLGVFTEFVQDMLDYQWDMVRIEEENDQKLQARREQRHVTPSA